MENNLNIFSIDGEAFSEPRSPLNPLMPASPNIPSKQIRRKSSFAVRVDSSEDLPSPHDSIFEALYTPRPDHNDDARDKFVNIPLNTPIAWRTAIFPENNENERLEDGVPSLVEEAEFLYGHGTALDTITEQKSYGTLRTQCTGDLGRDLPNFPFARHRDSFALNQGPFRRRQAFSHDDIDLLQESYHDACAMIEREAKKPLIIHELYTQPMSPIHEPLERPQTPEGMPSWTAAQIAAPPNASQPQGQVVPATSSCFRRFLRITPKPARFMSVSRSVSDPLRGRPAPRFRPPRSVYGNMEQHPFNSAPKARVVARTIESPKPSSMRGKNKSKIRGTLGVRFTPSATQRDSEINTLRTAIEATSISAPHPIEPFHADIAAIPSLDIKCPHAKGRAATAKHIQVLPLSRTATDPQSFEYVVHPPVMCTSPDVGGSQVAPSPNPERSATPFSFVPSECNLVMESNILRSPSISSTQHLMSGGIRTDSQLYHQRSLKRANNTAVGEGAKVQVVECWKCKLDKVGNKFGTFKKRSVNVLYYICCGHDVRDDGASGVHLRGGGQCESALPAPRLRKVEGSYEGS